MSKDTTSGRDKILGLVKEHYQQAFPIKKFVAGETPIPVSGKVFDEDFEGDGATEDLLEKLIDDAVQASRLKEKELWERYHALRSKSRVRSSKE